MLLSLKSAIFAITRELEPSGFVLSCLPGLRHTILLTFYRPSVRILVDCAGCLVATGDYSY
jgi:hypothetical protein